MNSKLPGRIGYAIAWKFFSGYGFVQEEHTGRQFFCTRHDINSAFQLIAGTPIRFDLKTDDGADAENDERNQLRKQFFSSRAPGSYQHTMDAQQSHDDMLKLSRRVIHGDEQDEGAAGNTIDASAFANFPIATNITDAHGQPFPLERQGLVLRVPTAGSRETGMLCEMHRHGLTTSRPLPVDDTTKHFAFWFSHSKRLEVGDLVRFWSTKDLVVPPGVQRRPMQSAKDVVRLNVGLLSVPEQQVLQELQQALRQPQDIKAVGNFSRQQKSNVHQENNFPNTAAERGQLADAAPLTSAPPSLTNAVTGVVQHRQGRFGKIEVTDSEGVSRSVFFHLDVVVSAATGKPTIAIEAGQVVRCRYEQVRQGKHAGTLRCTSVLV